MMKENPTTEIKLQQTNTSKKDKSKGRKNVRKVNSKKKERKKLNFDLF